LAPLYFWRLGDHALIEPDEGRYSEIPREMRATGDWVTPRLNGVKYFEKPALYYWMNAGAMELLGENEWASRIWPATTALGASAVTFLLAESRFGPRAGFLSGAILGSSLLWFALAHINLIDMALAFFISLAMLGFLRGATRGRHWFLLAYAGMALAVLAKGLVGLILPGGIFLVWAILSGRPRALWDAIYLPGLALFLALVLPWYASVSLKNPDFLWFFFVHEHFLRYATMVSDRWQPLWFFLPITLLGFIPWTGTILSGLTDGFRRLTGLRRSGGDYLDAMSSPADEPAEALFLLLWFLLILLFFSVSKSKLIPYILPALPPLAALGGIRLDELIARNDRRSMLFSLALNLLFCALLAGALWFVPNLQDTVPAYLVAAVSRPAAVLIGIGLAVVLVAGLLRSPGTTAAALLLLALTMGIALKPAFDLYGTIRSPKALAERIAPVMKPEYILANFGDIDQAWPFYLKRRVLLAENVGELEFGKNAEKTDDWFLSKERFLALWRGDRTVVCLIRRDRLKQLKGEGFSFHLLAEDPLYEDKCVIANRALPVPPKETK
jgi:4-amino-4-deoxy-L-arabinose transferase-like glycosyltransferase